MRWLSVSMLSDSDGTLKSQTMSHVIDISRLDQANLRITSPTTYLRILG